jgi:hypothetical protein
MTRDPSTVHITSTQPKKVGTPSLSYRQATVMTSAFTTTPLYGGAIVCEVPSSWKDVSDMRQVPDHQEVLLGPAPEEPSLVIEILDHQASISNETAAKYFFDDLAEANGCSLTDGSSTSFAAIKNSSAATSSLAMFTGIGMQRVAKGRDKDLAGNLRVLPIIDVEIELCVIRLPQVTTDLLVTLSRTKSAPAATEFSDEFQRILATLQIRDWSLFG